ncbi:MAG: tetratricopeptide repeat protein [Candidatus Omnitrophica bacterium]|nr:tetratricopeptide repeat protein [Candidatus Omnitrophota bacterium]
MVNSMMRYFYFCVAGLAVLLLLTSGIVAGSACAAPVVPAAVAAPDDLAGASTEDLVKKCWAASSRGDYTEIDRVVNAMVAAYEQQAMALHAELSAFPPVAIVGNYKVMNDVATALFIRAEGLMHQGQNDKAIAAFQDLIKTYPYAQSWDPSRGAFWSVAEKSRASLDTLLGKNEEDTVVRVKPTAPVLATPGTDAVVDYKKYGSFHNVGTPEYKYVMRNPNELAKAVGEGIYPNTGDVLKNPAYKQAYKEGRLSGSHWDFANTRDLEAAYLKWATAAEDPGVKMFFVALSFEKGGLFLEAIKAYHALIVHFPKTTAWTYWRTPWYPAQAAIGKIKNILRRHPELNLVYKYGKVEIDNSDDNDATNDVFHVYPGVIETKTLIEKAEEKLPTAIRQRLGKPRKHLGGKKVSLVKYANGHWRMFVNNHPFMIKAITYTPTKVGQSPDNGTVENWMFQDSDSNGKIDSPYKSWVDKNGNNTQDPDEPVVGDFQLMKEMGVNAIRLYHNNQKINKELMRDMYSHYGIMVIMGDFVGKYALGSGADWSTGTDYENPEHRRRMMDSVEQMVREFKDEPYILFWLLGNENNYGVACNADKKPVAYYKFINDVAKRIKEIDPDRPVAIANGDILYLDIFAKNAPNVDIFGANVYRGDYGFGSFWDTVKRATNKPAMITEYGAPAYGRGLTLDEGEEAQAAYHQGNWLDILENSAGYDDGEGNAIGGVAFEWMDEWWKNYEPSKHNTKADVVGPFAGGYYYEEWFGLVGQGDGSKSPYMRQLRKVYYMYKDLWNK